MIGQTISHYKILEKIGEGGMSVVYKAEDAILRRHIALKFPSDQVLADEVKKARFIQEARASAALDHPNICTLYEIAEAEGKTFISMAYIDGLSLYEKIKSGPLSIDEAVDISIQAAQGLSEAHEKGIVHRDIKSGNIMVTNSGQVKIMDFGLAKLTGETTETQLTQAGAIMGTVDYMSPEQAKGDPVDYRTDIWSLGVVMYEILTGELPFKGGNAQAVIHSILYEEPKCLRDLRSDIPSALEQIVSRMVQKDSSRRPDSMKAVLENLELLSSRSGLDTLMYLQQWAAQKKGLPSIAVLPFVNMSADPNQEYFCDGMAEELINALTQIEDLRVIARTSAFSFKGRNVPVRDIGSQLNVATILEGSVRKAKDKLRVAAQLVDVTSGVSLWSDSWDRQMGDVFAIQDEITLTIVDKLMPKLLGQEKARLANRQTVDLEVYNLYLKGLYFQSKRNEMDLKKAVEYFEQAIARDPNYALAYAGLALSCGILPIYSALPQKEVVQKGKEAGLKALQIDETLAEAHESLGVIKTRYDWDWEEGEREYKRAIKLNPGYAMAHQSYSFNLLFRARFEEAIKEIEQALELDPVSVVVNFDFGLICLYTAQFDRAINALKRILEMDPSIEYVHLIIGAAYLGKSMCEEALIEFQKEREISKGGHTGAEVGIGHVHVKMGKADEAQKVLDDLVERSEQEYVSPFTLACFHFLLGKNDEGFELLDRAYDEQDHWLCWLKIEPLLDSVRSDLRYTALLKKMNLDKR